MPRPAPSLTSESGLRLAIPAGIASLSLCDGGIRIVTGLGARLTGTLSMAIAWPAGPEPAIALDTVTHPAGRDATVTWPAGDGPVTQVLLPGTPMTLAGIMPGGTA